MHPFLYRKGDRLAEIIGGPAPGFYPVRSSRHHLYPKDRKDVTGTSRERFILKLWEHKHFYGWNSLFQFNYCHGSKKRRFELTIDEIITLMATEHPFIVSRVGSRAWKVLFKDKNLSDACSLLCRMLSIKFNYRCKSDLHPKVVYVLSVRQAA